MEHEAPVARAADAVASAMVYSSLAPTVGAKVRLQGLQQAPQWNGCEGTCTAFDDAKRRWVVKLSDSKHQGKQLSVKPEQLIISGSEFSTAAETPDCRVIFLIGPPASGKSTLGGHLAEQLCIRHIDIGQAIRENVAAITRREGNSLVVKTVGEALAGAKHSETLLLNGFPRHLDGLHKWQSRWPRARIAFALVLQAPDDVLRARRTQRFKTGARPEDNQASFDERLSWFHDETMQVVMNLAMLGQVRYIDATASREWVLQAALQHFMATATFVRGGDPDAQTQACAAAAQDCHVRMFSVPRDAASEDAVHLIEDDLRTSGEVFGGHLLVDGFPRHEGDLDAWSRHAPGARPIAALSVNSQESGAPSSGSSSFMDALRMFCGFVRCVSATGVQELQGKIGTLVKGSAPLSVAVGPQAVKTLSDWLSAARSSCWWALGSDAFAQYRKLLSKRRAAGGHATVEAIAPASCPSSEAWIVWFAHMMHSESYLAYTKEHLHGILRAPLSPPSSNQLNREASFEHIGDASCAALPAIEGLDARDIARAPGAFVDALGCLEELGLAPFGDPRALCEPCDVLMGVLQILSDYYRRFLLVLNAAGPDSPAAPPKLLDWIWHAHLTHPPAYHSDCQRLFSREIPHRPCVPSVEVQASADVGVQLMEGLSATLDCEMVTFAFSNSERLEVERLARSVHESGDDAEEAIVTLGCLLPGGDRSWLGRRLAYAGGQVAGALAAMLLDNRRPDLLSRASMEVQLQPLVHDLTSVELSVRLMSGHVVLQKRFPRTAKVADLRFALFAAGESQDNTLKLFCGGRQLTDAEALSDLGMGASGVVNLLRQPKPPAPREAQPCRSSFWVSRCCSCMTADCEVTVLGADGREGRCNVGDLHPGAVVRTGSAAAGERYRRVVRNWASPMGQFVETFQISPGLRLTRVHPILWQGRWCGPEDVADPCLSYEESVYSVELEGHVDTILSGGVVVACIGLHVEALGWNIFTRKSQRCDDPECRRCDVAVLPGVDFSEVKISQLADRYLPY